jgi:dTMP kinase
MRSNGYGGLFVAFDGPNGVGKSTLIECVNSELTSRGFEVFATKEPTDTDLGHFVRRISEYLDGESLTCLVAADRYQHLKETVIPQLEAGKIVITDRYVLSSLILQCMDNVTTEFVLATNGQALIPDIQVAVSADIAALQERLGERDDLTRFERGHRSEEELKFMNLGISALREREIDVLEVDNTGSFIESVSLILGHILEVKK